MRISCFLLMAAAIAMAGPDEDWNAIVILDAGPKSKASSVEEVRLAAANHLDKQRVALQAFLSAYPADPRAHEARLRLGSVLATSGMMNADAVKTRTALEEFSRVEKAASAPSGLRADAGFRKASLLMQVADASKSAGRAAIVAAAKAFSAAYPADVRAPRMLVEAATVCDAEPELKRSLLAEAKQATAESSLLHRINDDLLRLDLLGKPVEITMPAIDGGTLDLKALRGKPLLLVFWSSESPQSLLWLRDLRLAWDAGLAAKARVATINLDTDKKEALDRSKALGADWPVGYEPGGWQASTARRLGINALPTVWLLDAGGNLRSLNAKADWKQEIGRLGEN